MSVLSLLRILWRRIRRRNKTYRVARRQSRGLATVLPKMSTYISFNRPNPPSILISQQSRLKRSSVYFMEYSSCSSDADYSEIRTETNESTTNYVVDVDGKTAATALRRYDAISNLRSILHDTFKKKWLSVGHLDVNRWRSNLPDKNIPQFTSLFMPICSSTPLNISLESLTTILANEETKNFNRILRRHLSVPKFPPPPPPLEQKANSTFIVMENDDFALWEVEVPRSCSDSDDKDTSAEKDVIQLAEYSCDVNLNESFIEEVTFYVDDLPSSNVIMDRILTIKDVYISTSLLV